jgi:chaperonin GroEL
MNNTTTGQQAQEEMIKGIKVATQAIRPTYGHNGINAVIEDIRYPYHQVANDAQTIIQAIKITDPIQNQGLSFLKELSDKQNSMSGDGRKTTCIIAETILDEGFNQTDLQGLALKRELDSLIPSVEAKIDAHTQVIALKDIFKVATISGESFEIGELIQVAYNNIGENGAITVESSGGDHNEIKYISGVRFTDTGMLADAFVHDDEARKQGLQEKKAIYENPVILVTKQKIERIDQIDPLIQSLISNQKKELVIFTDDMDPGIAKALLDTHKEGIFNILIIKAPTIFRKEVFEDFAKITCSTIVEPANGIYLEELPLSCLGTCDKIIVDKSETLLIGIDEDGIKEHLDNLKANNDELSNLRIKWLNTATAILKLGANNESELSYKRLKCEDAVNASRLALKGGVVKGGGITIYNIASELPKTTAGQILAKALQAPLFQIMANSNITNIPEYPENVLDASIVLKNAIRNSISLASTVLTTGLIITLPEKVEELKI